MKTTSISFKEFLESYNKIIIPDVQRDYVMGSGGEKLEKLFKAMADNKSENFRFSCIVGHKDKDNNLYIYDGQQRMATLIFLCSFLDKNREQKDLYERFSFKGRDEANRWIVDSQKIKDSKEVDFTTYSIKKLINVFESDCLESDTGKRKPCDIIDMDFLLNKVSFDMVLVDKVSDAEQFFLDINDGLDLKPYEIFKAELYHHANEIFPNEKDVFKRISLKMENEWLELCLKYNNEIYEEEVLIYYLKYCFRMMWIEEKGNDEGYIEYDVKWLKKKHFERIEKITDSVVKNLAEKVNDEEKEDNIINYSIKYKDTELGNGQYWNILYDNHTEMLDKFFKNISNIQETKKDVVVWCYISNLPQVTSTEKLNIYLRRIKKY